MQEGRRLNPRLVVELPAEYRLEPSEPPRPGTIANLSAGGAAIMTASQLPPRGRIDHFRFALPEKQGSFPIEAAAEVVHARPYLDDRGEIAYFSGVHFVELEPDAFERVERFVLRHLRPTEA